MDMDTDCQTVDGEVTASVASCVIRVSDLDRSMRFYCDVFSCRVIGREVDMALLMTSQGFQIYLHEVSAIHRRGAARIPSVQYVMWATDSRSELQYIAERLRAHDTATYSHTVDGLSIIEGSDPDRCRVIVAYPSPRQLPRSTISERLRH